MIDRPILTYPADTGCVSSAPPGDGQEEQLRDKCQHTTARCFNERISQRVTQIHKSPWFTKNRAQGSYRLIMATWQTQNLCRR